MDINFNSTVKFTYKMLPLLKDNGRIINVSSRGAGLSVQGPNIAAKFSKEGLTLQDLYEAVEDYKAKLEKNELDGYCPSSYKVSKMLLNYWTRFILL